jgi:hypothetical protein
MQTYQRLRPFSHRPKTRCLIPGTDIEVTVYPTRIELKDQVIELYDGAVDNFTVVQDLEKKCLTLFSRQYHMHLDANLQLTSTKGCHLPSYQGPRLDFGVHKKPMWESLIQRMDLAEILPIWHRLGQFFSLPAADLKAEGNFYLLKLIQQLMADRQHDRLPQALLNLFRAGFHHMMIPRDYDSDYQGLIPKSLNHSSSISPLYLITEGAHLIRSLFLQTEGDLLSFLPHLPPQLFSGCLIDQPFDGGTVSFKWQKKQIREIHLSTTHTGVLYLDLPGDIKQFRVKENEQSIGFILKSGTPLAIQASSHYRLDRFEK